MKTIDEIYKEWCGSSRLENSVKETHDSTDAIEFAEYYYDKMRDLKMTPTKEQRKHVIGLLKNYIQDNRDYLNFCRKQYAAKDIDRIEFEIEACENHINYLNQL